MQWPKWNLLKPVVPGTLLDEATEGSGQLPTDGLHNVYFPKKNCELAEAASLFTQRQ
jgi:hypothetical protein